MSAEEPKLQTPPDPETAPSASADVGEPVPASAEVPAASAEALNREAPLEPAPAASADPAPTTAEDRGMSAWEVEASTEPAEPDAPPAAPDHLGDPFPVSAADHGAEEPEALPEPAPPPPAALGQAASASAEVPKAGPDVAELEAPPAPASPPARADIREPVFMSAEDPGTNAEEPKLEAAPEPAPVPSPPAPQRATPAPPPPPPQWSPAPLAQKRGGGAFVIAAVVVIALAIGGYLLARSGLLSGTPAEETYAVAAYTPPQPLVSARERVLAHAQPDASSPVVVMFGAGAALDVQGRVSRGIGNDWYQIRWNGRTAFVRQEDTIVGGEAPPGISERPKPEEEEEKPDEEEDKPDEAVIAEFPPLPPAGFDISTVRWIREPNARDFARFYPHRALDQGRSGRVVLDCVVAGSGRLDCSVAEENPPGWGFGDAAVSIARQTRIDPTGPDGSSVAGEHLRLPLVFRAADD